MYGLRPACLLDFGSFSRLHSQAHLVAAAVPDSFNSTALRVLGNGCRKLLQTLRMQADFAIGVVRNSGEPEFRCLFATSSDAKRFSACVGARHAAKQAFASYRRFTLDEALLEGLQAATGRARRRRAGLATGAGEDDALRFPNRCSEEKKQEVGLSRKQKVGLRRVARAGRPGVGRSRST